MNDLPNDVPGWPPLCVDEMKLWQDLHGTDQEIAKIAGISETTVASYRQSFGVASIAHPNAARNHDRLVRETFDQTRRDKLYRGRRYDD